MASTKESNSEESNIKGVLTHEGKYVSTMSMVTCLRCPVSTCLLFVQSVKGAYDIVCAVVNSKTARRLLLRGLIMHLIIG